eukprot:CAMPEP_0115510228 /NCGR_PEP_ID=MMETSP0271-20121206/73297_1 /TAXON_ID=71861 /ORGANISM="Scrippsiella trochoidea, Strain CCMP3099" /LENGTH=46 /DNA_ID= /DNA_START= /DNA_END= /DNA_ORIENTATION=
MQCSSTSSGAKLHQSGDRGIAVASRPVVLMGRKLPAVGSRSQAAEL